MPMLNDLLFLCSSALVAALFSWLGFKGASRTFQRDIQGLRDDVEFLAARLEREVKVRAGVRSVEQRQDNLAHAREIAAANVAAVQQPNKMWGRTSRKG